MLSPQGRAVPRRYVRNGLMPQLAAFEAVVRLGSAAQAAESLCIAPSTLSGHLRKLGETLGVRLFELEGKQLLPTAAAWALVAAVEETFGALARCERVLAPLRMAPARGRREGAENAGTMPLLST